MTQQELFERITTDVKILYYHDQLAMLDWKLCVCTKERRIVSLVNSNKRKEKIRQKQPRCVTLLKRYLKAEYGITNNKTMT